MALPSEEVKINGANFLFIPKITYSAVFTLHMNYGAIEQYVIEKQQSGRNITYVCSNYNDD